MGNAAIGQRRGWGRRVVALPARRSLLLLGFGLVVIVGLWATVPAQETSERLTQLALALVAVAGVAVSGRWPVIAVAVTTIATGAAWTMGLTADPFLLTGISLFAIAEKRGERRFPAWMVVGAVVVGTGSLLLGSDGSEDRFRGLLLGTIVAATAWALGVRTRAVRIEVEARRAPRNACTSLARCTTSCPTPSDRSASGPASPPMSPRSRNRPCAMSCEPSRATRVPPWPN